MIQFFKTPSIVKHLSRELIWNIDTVSKEIYITFDDGPIPDLTNYILDTLDEFAASATFFCVGDNIDKFPDIFTELLKRGHEVGNHTYNHLRGWSTGKDDYLLNIEQCQSVISDLHPPTGKPLFRPPHGQITKAQINALKDNYHIIMWDVLTYDFAPGLPKEKDLKKIIDHTRPGSIVVFHDNYKAENKLRYLLPNYLKHFSDQGYQFKKLNLQ